MATTTVSIEELERDASRVRKASERGPVFITEHGRPANVLLTIEEYRKLSGEQEEVVEPVATPGDHEIKFDRSRMTIEEYRQLTGELPNIVDLLANPEGYDIEFDPPRTVGLFNPNREVDLSD